jgi:hypothetical protein
MLVVVGCRSRVEVVRGGRAGWGKVRRWCNAMVTSAAVTLQQGHVAKGSGQLRKQSSEVQCHDSKRF